MRSLQTNATYKEKTARGGFLTLLIVAIIAILVWTEAREYLYGEAGYEFSVDRGVAHDLQLNFDATVATPCHCEQKGGAHETQPLGLAS